MSTAIATPCIKVCVLDPQSGLCIGCLRSGDEIAGWLAMGPQARAAVMADLPARADSLGPAALERLRKLTLSAR